MSLLSYILISVLLLQVIEATDQRLQVESICPNDFLRLGHSCYSFSAEMASWEGAYFSCRNKNSTLLSIENDWEDNLLRTYLNKPQLARLNRWIGGEYNWITGQWIWGSTGRTMQYVGFITNEPPLPARWQCAYMSPSLFYRWNHAFCMTNMHYICRAPQHYRSTNAHE